MSQTQQFKDTLNGYANQFPAILSDFIPAYVNTKLSPDNPTYLNTYNSCKDNITQVQSQLFITTNNIQSEIDNLNSNNATLDSNINAEQTKNIELTNSLQQILSVDSGASILIGETTEIYKTQYISNVAIIIGIIVLIIMLFSVYRKNTSQNI